MNDFDELFSKNYGFKPSTGKSTPMAPHKTPPSIPDQDNLFRPNRKSDFSNLGNFDDVFSNSKSTSSNNDNNGRSNVNFDSIFGGGGETTAAPPPKFSSMPVFDKPVYDDDVSSSPINNFDDIFAAKKSGGVSSGGGGGDVFDDLLGGLGKKETNSTAKSTVKESEKANSSFDDLLPGFGGCNSSVNRSRTSSDTTKKSSSVLDNPFGDLQSTSHHASSSSGVFGDPLEEFGNLDKTGSKKFETFSSGGVFDDIDPLNGIPQSIPPFSAETNGRVKAERGRNSSVTSPERGSERKLPMEDFGESPHSVFEMPSASNDSSRSVPNASSPVYNNTKESYTYGHASTPPQANMGSSDEVWLTVSEIPLFTQPTIAPPPSRAPPPRPARFSRAESSSYQASNAQSKVNAYSSFPGSNQYFPSPKSPPDGATASFASPLDELEEFATGRNQSTVDENSDVRFGEEFDTNSVAAASAAAMKEAMDRAEAKFRYARGVRERENAKVSRSKESVSVEKEEKIANDDDQDREFREGQERLMRQRLREREEGEERRRNEEEDRRRIEKEREEKEREKRRVERERELARQAVERATREARERAAIEARNRAERAAVQKANSEARERAERAAVQRAQAEARERAAADAKERAEKAATEAREKARTEAREKEARERAATAAASMPSQQKNEPDFDSIFGMGTRASSVPRPRPTSSGPFENQFQSKPAPDVTRNSVNSTSNIRKASSSTNIVDDLTSIFGGTPSSSGDFKDVDGETDDRRRARLERHQRTQERATKALAEKNARDLEAQREQAERHRISETLDVEIKRWAAGKEGNLRALLSTLQYVLWPECGWQPVSLTDLIMGASVKKVYRKATLCIHPDKVQQKGANLQQKYVAEKVFDLLKEAWNKFNSEELY